MYVTFKYRIKDSIVSKKLNEMASSVNYVWNYCNQTAYEQSFRGRWLTGFDLNKLTTGCNKELGLNSETINAVCEEHAIRRKQFKKNKLNWRSYKRSLGWIPFKSRSITNQTNGSLTYRGLKINFWQSRNYGTIKMGSFTQDSMGRWYVNLVCDVSEEPLPKINKSIGVDLGLKDTATYSDGTSFTGAKPTRKYADSLAKAQRANKKRQVKKIHKKIKNIRKDVLHKETTRLVKGYDKIVVGDVSSGKLAKTKMAKSVYDVSWFAYKSQLEYKANRLGRVFEVVNESWTSKTCSSCGTIQEWGGLSGLSVRECECIGCGDTHNRDVNAAKNILSISPSGTSEAVRESHLL